MFSLRVMLKLGCWAARLLLPVGWTNALNALKVCRSREWERQKIFSPTHPGRGRELLTIHLHPFSTQLPLIISSTQLLSLKWSHFSHLTDSREMNDWLAVQYIHLKMFCTLDRPHRCESLPNWVMLGIRSSVAEVVHYRRWLLTVVF